MSFLEWTHDLDTEIKAIDEQHKQIVAYINLLHDAQTSGNHDAAGVVLEDLIEYTINHFAEEEAMMEKAGYPLTEAHKGVHQRFIEKVSTVKSHQMAGTDTVDELLSLLEGWLFTHIRLNDQGYVADCRNAGFH